MGLFRICALIEHFGLRVHVAHCHGEIEVSLCTPHHVVEPRSVTRDARHARAVGGGREFERRAGVIELFDLCNVARADLRAKLKLRAEGGQWARWARCARAVGCERARAADTHASSSTARFSDWRACCSSEAGTLRRRTRDLPEDPGALRRVIASDAVNIDSHHRRPPRCAPPRGSTTMQQNSVRRCRKKIQTLRNDLDGTPPIAAQFKTPMGPSHTDSDLQPQYS
jgi:hypothetical protein